MRERDQIVTGTLNPLLKNMRDALVSINQGASGSDDFENAYYAGLVQEKVSTLQAQQVRFLITTDANNLKTVVDEIMSTIHDLYRTNSDLVSKLSDPPQLAAAKELVAQLPSYGKPSPRWWT